MIRYQLLKEIEAAEEMAIADGENKLRRLKDGIWKTKAIHVKGLEPAA